MFVHKNVVRVLNHTNQRTVSRIRADGSLFKYKNLYVSHDNLSLYFSKKRMPPLSEDGKAVSSWYKSIERRIFLQRDVGYSGPVEVSRDAECRVLDGINYPYF